jgi:hypothetical protein
MKRAVLKMVVLALLLGGAGTARAGFMFHTPSGVSPGEQFIVVFLDTVGGPATPGTIGDYNTEIAAAASGITYQGGTIGNWSIIGATASTNGARALFNSSLPVYDLDGGKLASSGVSYLTNGISPDIDQSGGVFSSQTVWTGLTSEGTPASPNTLGQPDFGPASVVGESGNFLAGFGLNVALQKPTGSISDYYGYATFTAPAAAAVPEPSSIMLAFVGGVGLVVGREARRRRAAVAV